MPAITWTTRYEDLRRWAHESGGTDGAWGLALFLRQGLVAWMQAWPAPATLPSPPALAASPALPAVIQSSSVTLPANLTRQLVPVLASMILARPGRLQEVCP